MVPPQSTSVSSAFLTLSVHEMQTPPTQRRAQAVGVGAAHLAVARTWRTACRRSRRPTSSPFLITSLHDEQRPMLAAAAGAVASRSRTALPSAHFGQADPPQSASVSPWFFTWSVQVGAEQTPAVQTQLTQSV